MTYEQQKLEYFNMARPYLDKDFSTLIEQEGHRLERESELILACVLLKNNYALQKKSIKKGPDFSLVHENKRVWIEVVTPNEGSHPKFKNTEILAGGVPMSEVDIENCKLQIASAIAGKKDKYGDYKDIVDENDIRLICINTYNFDGDVSSCPYLISILYGIDSEWYWDSQTKGTGSCSIKQKPVVKPTGSEISMGLFVQEDYKAIDGVLWFNTSLPIWIRHPEKFDIKFLANKDRREKIGELFSHWV